jgi:hypothetical protein
VSVADPRVLAREAVFSTVVAASLASILVWLGPPGVDLAAHAYQRTFLIQHGFVVWNNFWYAGRYTFVTYSVLYYPLAALLGIKVLAVATIAAAALAFTLVALRQWGDSARLSSRTFAVLWAGIVLSAAFPFALAMSFALLSLWALQSGRRWRFALLALLCLATSPLAFVLLGVLLGGVGIARRTTRDVLLPLAIMGAGAALEVGIYRLFSDGGRFPFSLWELAGALVFCAFGLTVTWDVPAARPLRGLFAVYLLACLAAFAIPTSVGSNIERIRYAALPIAVLALSLRRWRPLVLVVPALVLAAVWNLTPIVSSYSTAAGDPGRKAAYWQPAIKYLHAHLSPSFRVEAVDTADHWAAEYLPDAGIPIVRGWFRQADFPVNSVLYNDDTTPAQYDAWLRALGVRYVLLSDAPVDYSSRHEAALIRSGRVNLKLVFRSAHIRVYEVPDASPMITGGAGGTVLYLEPTRIVGEVSEAGSYHVKVRWTPFWRTRQGCVSRAKDGMVKLVVRHPGLVSLGVSVDVNGGLRALTGLTPRRVCGG